MSPSQTFAVKVVFIIGLIAYIFRLLGTDIWDLVGAPPEILEFSLVSPSSFRGELAAIQWRVDKADSVEISPGLGRIQSSVSRSIRVANQTYTLTAKNHFGPSTKLPVISANEPPTPSVQMFVEQNTQLNQFCENVVPEAEDPRCNLFGEWAHA